MSKRLHLFVITVMSLSISLLLVIPALFAFFTNNGAFLLLYIIIALPIKFIASCMYKVISNIKSDLV